MKNLSSFSSFTGMGLLLMLTNGCMKTEDPNMTLTDAAADADGNVYTSVTIGTQVWIVENLKTTKYNDTTAIPRVNDNTAWVNLSTPGYCWYNNDISNKDGYGALYNWYAVNTGKLCPTGWHVPSDEDWKIMERNLGMNNSDADATGWRYSGLVGGKLKESGTMHWMMPSVGATNTSGFSSRPGGDRESDLGFVNFGNYCYFWLSTEDGNSRAWFRRLNNDNAGVHRSSSRDAVGYSVRCLKN